LSVSSLSLSRESASQAREGDRREAREAETVLGIAIRKTTDERLEDFLVHSISREQVDDRLKGLEERGSDRSIADDPQILDGNHATRLERSLLDFMLSCETS
jgi:hypothetical protein